MGQFSNICLTRKGLALQAKMQTGTTTQAGATLEITRVAVGSGYLPENTAVLNMEELVEPVTTADITSNAVIKDSDGTAQLSVRVQNNADGDFYLREVGIFATGPDEEGEILYSYANAGDKADYMPQYTGGDRVITDMIIVTQIGNAESVEVNVTLNPEVYKSDFDDHRNAEIIDHPDGSVTTEKIASGAVTVDKLGSDVAGNTLPIGSTGYGTIKAYVDETGEGKEIVSGEVNQTNVRLDLVKGNSGVVGVDLKRMISEEMLEYNAVDNGQIKDNAVNVYKLANDAVQTEKIANGAVTEAKLSANLQAELDNYGNNVNLLYALLLGGTATVKVESYGSALEFKDLIKYNEYTYSTSSTHDINIATIEDVTLSVSVDDINVNSREFLNSIGADIEPLEIRNFPYNATSSTGSSVSVIFGFDLKTKEYTTTLEFEYTENAVTSGGTTVNVVLGTFDVDVDVSKKTMIISGGPYSSDVDDSVVIDTTGTEV